MSDFYDIANTLLNERALLIKDEIHYIAELEIYINSEQHPDPYVHQHPEQTKQGNFYFHRGSTKPDAKYKGGTFKGVDLTYGESSPQGDTYAGILIRSLLSEDGKLITGPCNVVNHILSMYKVDSIEELVSSGIDFSSDKGNLSFLHNKHDLLLVTVPDQKKSLFEGPRIGLGDKDPVWRDKLYRYTSIKKGLKLNTQLIAI
jgi:hypothetical protein